VQTWIVFIFFYIDVSKSRLLCLSRYGRTSRAWWRTRRPRLRRRSTRPTSSCSAASSRLITTGPGSRLGLPCKEVTPCGQQNMKTQSKMKRQHVVFIESHQSKKIKTQCRTLSAKPVAWMSFYADDMSPFLPGSLSIV
jgi:hypothetical protein